jgi:hypothetical protein
MSTLFTGTGYIIELVITILLLPLLIYLTYLISYGLGRGLNHLFLHGRSSYTSYLLFFFIGCTGFFLLVLMVVGASLIQVFSLATAEWWYQQMLPVGTTGNTIGIVCTITAGFLRGKGDEL